MDQQSPTPNLVPIPTIPNLSNLSTTSPNVLKQWENDELLGINSTVAMILYANIEYPELKYQYPNFFDRIKVIARYWKNVDSRTNTSYVQKAARNKEIQRTNGQFVNQNTVSQNIF